MFDFYSKQSSNILFFFKCNIFFFYCKQTQLQQNNLKQPPSLDSPSVSSSSPSTSILTTTSSSTTPSTLSTTLQQNATKIEQKPVECNLCHRKFKNIPALNGHMRLHGGYFKKDAETKKCDKKETNGPPLQTASIGIRALIEEKIISKRGKDLKASVNLFWFFSFLSIILVNNILCSF